VYVVPTGSGYCPVESCWENGFEPLGTIKDDY
jgi:hypothetical protein